MRRIAVDSHIVQQPKATCLGNPVSPDKVFFPADYISFGCIYKDPGECGVVIGQFEKFKMVTNMTDNQPIF